MASHFLNLNRSIRRLAVFCFWSYLLNMPLGLRDNILATLAYYDVFDFPLKEKEIFEFLINLDHLPAPENHYAPNFGEIKTELETLRNNGTIGFYDGFYFLFEKSYLVPLRIKREKLAKEKRRKAIRAVKWLRFVPYLKGVFASGSLAMSNTDELSDLDVLVVVRRGRIWLARLLVSGLLSLLNVRRKYNQKIAPDKICPNHYITDGSLHIPFKSIYNAQTYINLKPIFVSEPKIISDFFEANSWLGEYILNFEAKKSATEKINAAMGHNFLTKTKSKIGELILNTKLGNWLENRAGHWQIKKIENHKKQDPPGGRVVYNDNCLEFHPGSVEKEIIEKYNQRLKNLGLCELAVEKDSGLD